MMKGAGREWVLKFLPGYGGVGVLARFLVALEFSLGSGGVGVLAMFRWGCSSCQVWWWELSRSLVSQYY